jgi:hypothetical protein
MRVAGCPVHIHTFAQVRVVHHWMAERGASVIDPRREPLLQRQLARIEPRICREPARGPGRCA